MSKYSNDFKLEVVQYYLKNYGGYGTTAMHFNIPSPTTVKKWVKKYEQHGFKGLIKNKISSYDGEFKENVIRYMHENHLSIQETSYHFNLGCPNVVAKWEHIYYEKGPQALCKEHRGKKKNMNPKKSKKKNRKTVENNEDLISELQQLRMENAYLKKLQALVQERTKPKHPKK